LEVKIYRRYRLDVTILKAGRYTSNSSMLVAPLA
jgi:hypothetical protein